MHAGQDDDSSALRTVLRSIGQTVLQCNALTGACVLAALALCDLRLACAALIGAVTAQVSARLVHYEPGAIRDGLHGFNGVLCALAAASIIDDTQVALAVALLSAIAATCLALPASRWLSTRALAVYSSPCLVVTWGWLALRASAHASTGPSGADIGHVYGQGTWVRFPYDAWFDGGAVPLPGAFSDACAALAQTVFASGALPGLLIAIGIALASRRAAVHALLGAAVSSAIGSLCGESLASLHTGVAGFNGALAALALVDRGAAAAGSAVVLSALVHQAAAHWGWPAMSAPFVASVWCVRTGAAGLINRYAPRPPAPRRSRAGD